MKRQAILVLGMHRSGTSAITGVLSLLGVHLPATLEPANEWNEKGYWESRKLMKFHDRLLMSAGSDWSDWGPFDGSWMSSTAMKAFLQEFGTLLTEEFGSSPLFVVKDPRVCRFVPFWLRALDALDIAPKFVLPVRNPLETARSLAQRDGLQMTEGLLLWLRHSLDAEAETRGRPRSFLRYDDLLGDWRVEIEKISRNLALELPRRSEDDERRIDDFLTGPLRHHVVSQNELSLRPEVFEWIKLAYGAFDRLVESEGTDEEALKQLDNVRREFDQSSRIFAPVVRNHSEVALADARREEAATRAELKLVAAQAEELRGELQNSNIALAEAGQREKITSAALETRNNEFHRAQHALRAARARPFKTLKRFMRWRGSAFILKFESILSERMTVRMRRRMEKASPLPPNELSAVSAPVPSKPARTKRMKRKYKISRFILKFQPILPRGFARRMRSRMEKNGPSTYSGGAQESRVRTTPRQPASYRLGGLLKSSRKGADLLREQEYVALSARETSGTSVRAIAFYLPQFHPIPENDEWWGRGFTEWTNVSKATPQFLDHDQPRLPGELGFYDLRIVDVQRRQVELAKQYGIHGFCFHYYWFSGGKRLLEKPLNQFVENKDLDFPFCVCWANENWTRRWDGNDQEILMEQRYEPQDDLEIIKDLLPLLKDPRYIKVNGRPVIVVYRVTLLPDPQKTAQIWRDYCKREGVGDPLLVAAQSFKIDDPRPYGFDAAVEFPPHGVDLKILHDMKAVDPAYEGTVYDYGHIAESSRRFQWPDYMLFKGIMPSWDNEARKPGRGHVYQGSTPAIYRDWLAHLCRTTEARYSEPEERLVFINAWNEWGEGAYLEPDRRYGYAYLEATRDALEVVPDAANKNAGGGRLVLVSHNALPYGAQFLALNLTRTLTQEFGCQVDVVLLGEGSLKAEFERWARVHDLSNADPQSTEAVALAARLRAEGAEAAICNTAVSGHFLATLKDAGFRTVSLIHEMPGVLAEYGLESAVRAIATQADHVVFPAEIVAEGFEQIAPVPEVRRVIRTQGLYKRNRVRSETEIAEARNGLRQRFSLTPDTKVVLSVGHVSPRKGTDLFVEAALHMLRSRRDVVFLWLGLDDPAVMAPLKARIEEADLAEYFIFPGLDADTDPYYAGADVYAMCSREDPFPSVVLEALDAGLPVVTFSGTGGAVHLVERAGGALVRSFDVEGYAQAILDFLDNPVRLRKAGVVGREIVCEEFSFRHYAEDLLVLCGACPPRISVVVPNFNYAGLLADRIATIAEQTYPVHEIIVLDDASTDQSETVARAALEKLSIPSRLVVNERNSGSVFRQWLRGVEEASGDYVWIAEADDLSESDFLSEVMAAFQDPGVVMSYCQSKQMDGQGQILSDDYLEYVSEISSDRWRSAYLAEGRAEIRDGLAIKNTIPNVSGVVFRKDVLLKVLRDHCEEIASYRVAGDWLTYVLVLEEGKIAYSPAPLNLHRRHQASVTIGSNQSRHLAEIVAVQARLRERYAELNEQRQKADAYAQKIYEQFGLKTEAHPRFSSHPDVAPQNSQACGAGIRKLRELSDQEWFDKLVRSIREPVIDGVEFPRFPSEVTQSQFVGSSNESALHEGYSFYRAVKSHSETLGAPVGPKTRLLDFGCGWGRYLRFFWRDIDAENLFGCDVDPNILSECVGNNVPGAFETISPMGKLPYPDAFFDNVIAYSVFTHLPEDVHEHWMREIARVMKPGGVFLLTLEPRRFLQFISDLVGKPIESGWHRVLAKYGEGAGDLMAQFDAGKFIYMPTGGGDFRAADVYGEAVVPLQYIREKWRDLFEIHKYIDDPEQFWQAVLVARKL